MWKEREKQKTLKNKVKSNNTLIHNRTELSIVKKFVFFFTEAITRLHSSCCEIVMAESFSFMILLVAQYGCVNQKKKNNESNNILNRAKIV